MDPAPTVVQVWHSPPRGRGRRRVADAPASQVVRVRLTETEHRALTIHALSRGQTATETVRQALAQHLAEPVQPSARAEDYREVIARLGQIGGLLKQHLVRGTAVGGTPLRTVLADLTAEINRLRNRHGLGR